VRPVYIAIGIHVPGPLLIFLFSSFGSFSHSSRVLWVGAESPYIAYFAQYVSLCPTSLFFLVFPLTRQGFMFPSSTQVFRIFAI